ncbi:MAG: molecular chaperone TorD family protein [gamma proteobacterium endosymbiont of Lamellibrachia anaximandri]|nr:molecular chaperone TorD family protein [gamma proteobacterium endosymbiont of Lamellibrachia anaximandri]
MGNQQTGSAAEKVAIDNALAVFCAAVAEDLSLFALLHDVEPERKLLASLRREGFSTSLGLSLKSDEGVQSLVFFDKTLKELPENPGQDTLDQLAADFASIYLNYGINASPEESVWIDEENLICQDSMFQVRNCYERHGLGVEDWRIRPDDHLVMQLRFMQFLFENNPDLKTFGEVAQFMDEHLLRWLMQFSNRVANRCDTPYFAGLSLVTAYYCEELRDLLANILDEPRPTPEEIEERMKPKRRAEAVPVSFMPGMGPAV